MNINTMDQIEEAARMIIEQINRTVGMVRSASSLAVP